MNPGIFPLAPLASLLCLACWFPALAGDGQAKPLLLSSVESASAAKARDAGDGSAPQTATEPATEAAGEPAAPRPKKGPVWWRHPEYRLQRPDAKENNFGVLNLGQLKNMAAACAREMEQSLPGGAGPEILSMLRRWIDPENKTNNYAVANTGQLKNVVSKFYDRLIAEGYATEYPWAHSTRKPNHFAVANIGQLKHLFDFDIEADRDRDGLPDMWEMATHGSLEVKGVPGSAPARLPGFNVPYLDQNFNGLPDAEEEFPEEEENSVKAVVIRQEEEAD